MKIYIIAGEASGDLHGSNLIRALLSREPSCEIRFWGGDLMSAAGGTLVRHYRDSAVMGAVEVLSKAGKILSNLSFCKKDIAAFNPDAVILVDYPGFNLKIAEFAHRRGFRVFYYIAPKLWAHGEGRIAKIRRYVDKLFVIFPFEQDYFRSHGVEVEYYGNPLLDNEPAAGPSAPERERKIVLLAGSRKSEVNHLMPKYLELEKLISADSVLGGYELVLAIAPSMTEEDFAPYLKKGSSIRLVSGKTSELLHSCTAAVVANGTANLEAAIADIPQVSCYIMNSLTFTLARLVVKIRMVSLPNIIMGRFIIRELLQKDATAVNLFNELKKLVCDGITASRMKAEYSELRTKLGGGGASSRIADAILKNIKIKQI